MESLAKIWRPLLHITETEFLTIARQLPSGPAAQPLGGFQAAERRFLREPNAVVEIEAMALDNLNREAECLYALSGSAQFRAPTPYQMVLLGVAGRHSINRCDPPESERMLIGVTRCFGRRHNYEPGGRKCESCRARQASLGLNPQYSSSAGDGRGRNRPTVRVDSRHVFSLGSSAYASTTTSTDAGRSAMSHVAVPGPDTRGR